MARAARPEEQYGIANYGFFEGDWFVWGGLGVPSKTEARSVNQSRTFAEFTDGLSNTLFMSEGKGYLAYFRCSSFAATNVNAPSPDADPAVA